MIEYEIADGFWARAAGLLGRCGMPPQRALFFPRCKCIHTFGMRFALDLVFVRSDGTVDAVRRGVRPWRIVRGTRHSDAVYELEAGSLPPDAPRPGERLDWIRRS
ncbi:MAG: DUF192 domain-containing protein [bacterium]